MFIINSSTLVLFRDKIVDLEKKRKDLNKHRNCLSENLVLFRNFLNSCFSYK